MKFHQGDLHHSEADDHTDIVSFIIPLHIFPLGLNYALHMRS